MLPPDSFILMVMGGVFVLLGLVGVFWGRGEEKGYYDSISSRVDVREYLEHIPQRPQPEALKIGGWIAIGIGLLMIAMGGAFMLLSWRL